MTAKLLMWRTVVIGVSSLLRQHGVHGRCWVLV